MRWRAEPKTDHWSDDPDHPPSDWFMDVADGNTRLGYADWVNQQREIEAEAR